MLFCETTNKCIYLHLYDCFQAVLIDESLGEVLSQYQWIVCEIPFSVVVKLWSTFFKVSEEYIFVKT